MNRLLTATAVSSLLLSGAAAEAAKKPSPRAKVYNATLAPLAGTAYSAVTAKAQLVDSKKADSAKIQVKGLPQPGAEYDWVIYKVNGDKPACGPDGAGSGVEQFVYKPLEGDPSGNASSTAKSKRFVAFSTTRYAVRVSDEEGVVVGCGELTLKKAAGKKPPA